MLETDEDAVRGNALKQRTEGELETLLTEIRGCRACEAHLPLGPRPVVRASATARLLIVGQAPGTRVHASGIPWDDPSGVRLRSWLDLEPEIFYDEARIAIVPMGYCYPGRGRSGDLPPRRECADLWLDRLLSGMPDIHMTLLIGQYSQRHFLGDGWRGTLTSTVEAWRDYLPDYLPLPHPSPRNQSWWMRRPWFEAELLPELRAAVAVAIGGR